MIVELPKFVAVLLLGAVPSLIGPPSRATTPLAPAVTDTTHAPAPRGQQKNRKLPVIGKPAPQLSVQQWLNVPAGKTLGKTTTFGDGHVYVLDFTATWCPACPEIYPILDSLQRVYGTRGLRIIYVTAIWSSEDPDHSPAQQLANLPGYITSHHMSYPMAVMANGDQFASSGYFPFEEGEYQAGLPRVVLIDGAGIVRAVNVDNYGLLSESVFLNALGSAIAASHPTTP